MLEVDGHDLEALSLPAATPHEGQPVVVLARTDPCRDIALLRSRIPKLHYVRFKTDEERAAYEKVLAEMNEE